MQKFILSVVVVVMVAGFGFGQTVRVERSTSLQPDGTVVIRETSTIKPVKMEFDVTVFKEATKQVANLQVATVDTTVEVYAKEDSFWGLNEIRLRIPVTFKYSVDLYTAEYTPDLVRKELTIDLPARFKCELVTEANPKIEVVGWAIGGFRSTASFEKLKAAAISEHFGDAALRRGDEIGLETRREGKFAFNAIGQLFRGAMQPGIKIRVRMAALENKTGPLEYTLPEVVMASKSK